MAPPSTETSRPAVVPSCLIVSDGGPAFLLALWREISARSDGGEVAPPVLWIPRGISALQRQAIERASASIGGQIVQGEELAAVDGSGATRMLLAAGETASAMGAGRLVWPVHGQPPGEEHHFAGRVFDRALLTSRLLAIDTRAKGGTSVVFHTPFAELTDLQLMDLAADMDVPVGHAAWCLQQARIEAQVCGSCAACERWLGAMAKAGIVAQIAQLPAALLEDKLVPAQRVPVG